MCTMSDYPYNFDVKITETLVYLPKHIVSQLDFGKSKRLRIDGEINGIRIECGLMPDKGKWCFMVSKKLQKLCGIAPGDTASVSFDIADSEAVVVPKELQFALEANDAAMSAWEKWTAGKRRAQCHRVSSAKRVETRERRAEEVIALCLAELGMQAGVTPWQAFENLDMRAGTITAVANLPKARKPAYKVTADFGSELGTKRTSAQITVNYSKDELVGRQIIGVVNIPPKQIGTFMSEFLIVGFYRDDGSVILAIPDKSIPNGAKLA
ncbi:chaperonin involved in protein secretion (CsaA protein) [Rhodopirellula baltica SH 1]|uniref:Chaperonin involved in protein secretion (CsaA protein) n=2 Tax=Rhodopirellula baltica TaxID=265606 RepID=Q7UE82_RHOBA|nr:chaperonin involved in protein secretion (CsaA protein) [Rhodopirellula baltica SH 1]